MRKRSKRKVINIKIISFLLMIISILFVFNACKKTSGSGNFEIIDSDETVEAGKLVADANQDLTKIKVLYKDNEGKREEIKKALEANDPEKVKKTSDDVVYLINDGMSFGKDAVDKIERAQSMNINDDYREYLQLKQRSLEKELEAFENYRQAARSLRDNYDPKNKELREKVKEDFKTRNENYRKIMETARDLSNQANILAKNSTKKVANDN